MPLDDRLVEMLMQAEDLRAQGGTVEPAELCKDCPELLPELVRLLRGTDAVQQLLSAPVSATQPDGRAVATAVPPGVLPQVRGYEIQRELGRGGMGVVYEANQQALGRRVALKVLPTLPGQDPRRVSRFKREVRAAARLHHTNIVPVFEVGEDAGLWFYAMQYIPGQPISDVLSAIRRHAPGSVGLGGSSPDADPARYFREVATAGKQVAEALACAHDHGVLHRDIKPANLIADDSGRVWVTDFGLAKIENEDLTQSGTVLGTLRYAAPEQIRGAPDARSDLYSLGLTLYELLTLKPAFDADSPLQLLDRVAHTEPPRPRSIDPRIPADLETIVLKAIDKEPARRYQSAGELAADLQRFLADEPIRARPIGIGERLVRWARRRPALAALSCGLLLVTVLGFAGITWQWSVAVAARGTAEHEKEHVEQLFQELHAKHETILRQMYRANIVAATDALQLTNTSAVRNALAATPESQRGWEWRHLFNQLDISRAVLRGHERPVLAVAIRPDGRRAVSIASDGSLRLWDPAGGTLIAQLAGLATAESPPLGKTRLPLTPDGRWVVYAPGDGTLRVTDTETGQPGRVIRSPHGSILDFDVSRDGKRVAGIIDGRSIDILSLPDGDPVASVPCASGRDNRDLFFSPDGQSLACISGEDRTVRILDIAQGKQRTVLAGHTSDIDVLVYSPDGTRLATGSNYPDDTVRLWDAATGAALAVLKGHKNRVTALAFSPDGRRLASGSTDHTLCLWDAIEGRAIATLRGHTAAPWRLAFNPAGTRLASAAGDQTVRLWDGISGEPIAVLRGHADDTSDVTFSADGKLLASSSVDRTVRLWDLELVERSGVLRGHGSFVYDVVFSPDGERVASVAWDGTARTWDATTGRSLAVLEHESPLLLSVAFAPDGQQLAVLERNHSRVTVWDTTTRQKKLALPLPEVGLGNSRVAISRSGDLLAAGASDGTIHLWKLPQGTATGVLRGHTGRVTSLAFRPDGQQLATVAGEKAIWLWDVPARNRTAALPAVADSVYHLAYSADGRLLAGAAGKDVYLWDVPQQQELAVLHHGVQVFAVAFSPETGRVPSRLAAGCADNAIRLWDVATASEVADLRGHEAYVHAVAFSPDGTRLVSGSGDGTVRVWDSLSVQERAARRK
jgi:WD40 repeat protein/tRNA A-37 threonylcarbamoyl transferase component Bud32